MKLMILLLLPLFAFGAGNLKHLTDKVTIGQGNDVDLEIVLDNGDANKPYIKYDSATSKWVQSNDGASENNLQGLPDQATHAGKFLSTDSVNASWETIDALPDQTGNAGKFLTTNGTISSWAGVPLTFQEVYDGSTQPQITLDGTNNGMQILDNSTPIASPLFEILNNAAAVNYFSVDTSGISLTTGAKVNSILDEDAMGSDSATALATQQSIKAYADANLAVMDKLSVKGDILVHNGTNYVQLSSGPDGATLVSDSSDAKGVKWDDALFATLNAVVDVQSETPTLGFTGTTSTNIMKYWIVGDRLFVDGTIVASSTGDGSVITVTLPNSLSMDTSKMSVTNTAYSLEGVARYRQSAGVTDIYVVSYNSDTSIRFKLRSADTNMVGTNMENGRALKYKFNVPVLGHSSGLNAVVQNKVLRSGRYKMGSAQTGIVTATSTTVAYDTYVHGNLGTTYNTSTGVYTLGYAGCFEFVAGVETDAINDTSILALNVYVNDSAVPAGNNFSQGASVGGIRQVDSGKICLDASDNVRIKLFHTHGSNRQVNAVDYSFISIQEIPDTVIQAVNLENSFISYTTNAGQAFFTNTIIKYEDDADSANNTGEYNTSNGLFTAVIAGFYSVHANILAASTAYPTTGYLDLKVYINGSGGNKDERTRPNGATTLFGVSVSGIFYLDVGDTLSIIGNSSISTTLDTTPAFNSLQIKRIP